MTEKPTSRFIAPTAVALVLIVVTVVGVNRMGLATMVIISGSAAVAYFVWLATTWRRPLDASLVTPPYIVLIAMELIHMAEEQVTNFPRDLSGIFSIPPTFNLLAHAVALMGAVNALAMLSAVGLRSSNPIVQQLAGYVVWFYVLGPGFVNAIAHFTFPFLAGDYVSGLATVILPTVAGIWTLRRMIQSDTKARQSLTPHAQFAS